MKNSMFMAALAAAAAFSPGAASAHGTEGSKALQQIEILESRIKGDELTIGHLQAQVNAMKSELEAQKEAQNRLMEALAKITNMPARSIILDSTEMAPVR